MYVDNIRQSSERMREMLNTLLDSFRLDNGNVEVMNETGHNLPSLYRETSTGGLAKRYNDKK